MDLSFSPCLLIVETSIVGIQSALPSCPWVGRMRLEFTSSALGTLGVTVILSR